MFCGSKSEVSISSLKSKRNIFSSRAYGQSVKNKSDFESNKNDNLLTFINNAEYYSITRDNTLIIRCKENNCSGPIITYDVLYIDIKTSQVEKAKDIEPNMAIIFSKLGLKLGSICSNPLCKSYCTTRAYDSTKLLVGAKSNKLMPFFLRNEILAYSESESEYSDVRFFLLSDYYEKKSCLSKTKVNDGLQRSYITTLSSDINLPLIDLSIIKTKEDLQYQIDSIIMFS